MTDFERIYLQQSETEFGRTWAHHRIEDDDTEYIRADLATSRACVACAWSGNLTVRDTDVLCARHRTEWVSQLVARRESERSESLRVVARESAREAWRLALADVQKANGLVDLYGAGVLLEWLGYALERSRDHHLATDIVAERDVARMLGSQTAITKHEWNHRPDEQAGADIRRVNREAFEQALALENERYAGPEPKGNDDHDEG